MATKPGLESLTYRNARTNAQDVFGVLNRLRWDEERQRRRNAASATEAMNVVKNLQADAEENEKRRQEYAAFMENARATEPPAGPNALTPEMEARYQQANGVNRAPTAYQTYMMQVAKSQPAQEETRSTDELRRDMNRQNRIARGTERMTVDMAGQGLRDQSLLFNPTYTSNLRTMGQTMEAQQNKAAAATNLYQTLSVQRREQEEREKYSALMQNPDFAAKNQGDPAIGRKVSATSLSPAERLYQNIYNHGGEKTNAKDRNAAEFVSDEEAGIFFYLWNTQGPRAAQSYYNDYVDNRASQRRAEEAQRQAEAFGHYDVIGSSAESVVANFASGVGLVDMAWQNIARSIGLTDKNKPLNYYSSAQLPGLVSDAIRKGAADELAEMFPKLKIGKGENAVNVASFLYQTGMSMADSGVAVLLNTIGIPEAATLANMGAAAGTRAIRDARERGATDGQALAFGISSAIMEALFEKISLDRILEPSYAQTAKAHFLNALKQSFTEGSEEVMTTLANTAMDQLIMGDKSELFTRQRQLMEQGVSEKEALGAAFKQLGTEIVGDLLGGMISGFGMGGAKEVGTGLGVFAQGVRQDVQTARALTDYQNAQPAAPRIAPQAPEQLTVPSQQTQSARQADPLGYAMNKAAQGETVTKSDARAIIENPQALQALRDSGVLTGEVKNESAGRQKVVDAVNALAERNTQTAEENVRLDQETAQTAAPTENESQQEVQFAQETAQERTTPPLPRQMTQEQQERVSTPPLPQNAQNEAQEPTLRVRAQEEQTPQQQETLRIRENEVAEPTQQAPLTIRGANATVEENRQEESYGQGQQTETAAAAGEGDFRSRAETAAEGARRSYLDRIERSSGLGRVLQDLRNYRVVRGAESRASEVSRIRNQAKAGNQRDVSALDYGVANGSAEQSAKELDNATASRVLGRNWDRAVAELARQGWTLKGMTGQLWKQDGPPVRAFINGDTKTIVVQVDHTKLSWDQLLAHEDLHRRIQENKDYRKAVEDALLADEKLRAYLPEIIDRYAQAYAKYAPDLTSDDVIEELLADYRAGFDMLDPLGMNPITARAAKRAAKDIKSAEKTLRKQYETNGGKPAPADIEENFAEAKNSVEPPYRLGTKAAQAFEDGLNEQARSVYDMFLNVRNASLENTAVMTVGAGKKAHPKRVTIADRFLTAADWNDQVKNDPEFAQAAKNIFSVIPESIRKNARLNDDGTISETEFEKRFKMARSLVQRLVDALPKGVVGSTVELDGKSVQVARGRVTASVGGEEYRRALIAEKRRLYEEGSLPTRAIGTLSHDNWGAMGFLATNTKTIASGDFTTFCPQMYFNDGCWYCYRRAALTSGVNNKLTAETVWYAGEILQLRQADIDRLNQVGGLRIQSFGDWMMQYSTMLADMLIDAEKVGLQIKIITKEPSMIDTVALLKEQGLGKSLYFNLSADYTIEKRGKVDNTNTSDALPMNPERPFMQRENESGEEETWWKRALTVQEANEYRKMYPWVNTRIVATNLDEFIRGLSDPTVDVVTGYHGDIRQQERVSSETGETLLDVEPLGDAGMPRFAYDRKTGEWTLEYEGKSRYQKQLAQRIQEEGLEREYYTKSCCIFGRCAKCQGKCGSYARSFAVKNATNRDQESVKYWQREMESGVDNPLLESQQEGKASTEISEEDVGTTLRTAKGSPIKRSSKYGVGKEIGGRVYFHKQYAEDVIPSNEYERAQQIVAEEYPDFTYNCVEYEPKTGTIRFDEAPGFDTEREPSVGDYVEVKADGSTRKGHTDYIWHHKWSWVKNDYQGFDVAESWNWSKQWLEVITGKTYEVNGKQYNDNGKSDGNGIGRWNAQLDAYGLPKDEAAQSKTDKFSLDVVPTVNPSNGKWARGLTEQQIKDMGYQLFGDVSQEEIDAMTPEEQEIYRAGHNTQVKNTVSSYQKVYDRLKAEHPDDWQNLRVLDASSGLGYGTQAGREMGFDVTDIEPYPSAEKYANGKPKYTDYSALVKSIRDGKAEPYDVIISNAVLNVLPQDTVDNLVAAMGNLLKPGGEMYINTRDRGFLKDVLVSDKNRLLNYDGQLTINSTERDGKVKRQAVLPEGLPAYDAYIAQTKTVQRGFTYDELAAYLEDALGPGYTVSKASFLGSAAAKVTKNGGSASIEIDPEVAAQFSPEAIARRQSNRTKGVKGERKVSRVRSNTYEYSGLFNAAEADMIEANEQNYTYDVTKETTSMNNARKRLADDFDGEVTNLGSKNDQWSGEDLDTAMGILHRYRTEGRATGDYGDFWRWSKVIQEKGTIGGKFIQAFAKYTRTGTGAAMKGAKDIHDRFKLNPAQQKQVDAAKKKLMDGIDGDMSGAAQDAMKQAKGQKEPGKKQDGKVDKKKLDAEVQRRKDAERLVREISKLFEKQQNHGEPVENWLNLTGEELARKIAGRFSEPKQRAKTTMQTILSDLVGFAEEHALPDRKKAEGTKRTAIDTITDYLNNRDAYGTAWAAAQSYLRAAYTDDQEKLDALNSFLTATIAYNAEGTDRTMLDAILQSADVLGISEKRILELTSAGATASTIDRIGDELVNQVKERMGADYDESFTQQLKDAVRRHITGIALQESAEDQRLRLGGMTTNAARQLEMNLQKLLTQSRGDKNRAAQSVADYLIRELGIPSSDAAIAAERITGAFTDELASRADRKLQQMFAEKKPKTQEQRDRLLDLIRLGGLTNSNVEDAVVDALGIGGMSRERQRELVGSMARFGETLDAMEADDAEGLRQLIREQAAVRGTKLSRLSEKTLSGETDIEYLRDFALAQLASIAGDFENRSAGEMISTYQTISHLLNMRTALRNVTSNQVFDLIDSAANNVSLLPDIALSLMTGKRTVGLNKSWASQQKRQGAVQGARRNALEVNLDVGVDDRQKSKYGTAGRRTWAMASSRTAGKILSHLEEVMGYELNTTDEFHKGSVMGETLESLSRFVDRGDMTLEEAQEFATEMALYRSFQDDSLIGTMLSSIKDALNLAGVGEQNGKQLKGKKVHDFGLGDFVTKYTQVPGALVHRAIEFSPLGYAKALFNLGQLANARRQGYETNAAQRKAALAIGRATTGTGLITLFAALAKAGLLRRDEDEDKNAKAAHQAQGLNGTQLNLTALGRWIDGESTEPEDGDILVDINFLEPLDALMGLATLVANEDERNAESIINDSITAVWDSISSLSMMQTLRDAYNVYQYYDENAEDKMPLMNQMLLEIASSSLSGFIPSPVRQLAQATDTTYRDQYRSKKISDQMWDKVKNSIPGLRQTLAPKITPLGEDKKYEKPLLNYLNATLNPGNISVYKSNKIVSELNRVYDETDDAKIWPERNAPYSFTANDEKWTLTPDERTQFQRTRGQTTAKAMEAVMGTDWYKSMSPTSQAEVLNWIGNFANFVAKKEMLEARGEDYGSTTYNKYYEAWQSGTPIEEVVADKYGKLVKAAEETAAAETIIAEAKIPEASKEEAETMSADAKRYYAGFLKGGVSDETARKLATELDGSEASGHEQWRMVYDAAGKEGEKAVTSVMTDDMKRNWNLAKDAGVSMDDYIKVREGFKDLNGNGNKSQDEWNATLDSFTFSTNAAKDKSIKGTLWQILTGSESTKNNPYDRTAGQAVIDAKKGGGSGSGSYAPARIPTLRIPEVPKATKPSSGLRIRPVSEAAARTGGGLRLRK